MAWWENNALNSVANAALLDGLLLLPRDESTLVGCCLAMCLSSSCRGLVVAVILSIFGGVVSAVGHGSRGLCLILRFFSFTNVFFSFESGFWIVMFDAVCVYGFHSAAFPLSFYFVHYLACFLV